MPDPPKLIACPYHPPRGKAYRVGRTVGDLIRGEVTITGASDAPIIWPVAPTSPQARRHLPVVTAELARAIRTESCEAVAYHWGISRWAVRRWRHALDVGRFTPGTLARWGELASKLHTPAARKHQRAAMRAWAAGRSKVND
jgi:hypothetical protein